MKTTLLITFSKEAIDILEETEKKTFEEKVQELRDCEHISEDYDFKVKEFDTDHEMTIYMEGVRDANGWSNDAVIDIKQ